MKMMVDVAAIGVIEIEMKFVFERHPEIVTIGLNGG
jgi:hypothetical protein